MRRRRSPVCTTEYSTVVCCRACEWRSMAQDPIEGWLLLAHHMKAAHDDEPARQQALKNASALRLRRKRECLAA